MPDEPRLRRTIWLYFGFQFFFSLLLWLPVFYAYQRRIGLTDTQIFQIQSLYYIAFCFLEIPTGMFADQFGRRSCMRLGAVVLVIANLLPIFVQTYTGFLIHFLLIAVARSSISGASSAYLYDFLARYRAASHFKTIEGRARAYSLYGKVVCWSFIGAAMEYSLTLPYWLTVASALLSVVFALALPATEAEQKPGPFVMGQAGRHLLEVGSTLLGSPFLVIVILQGIAAFVLGRIVQVNVFQPILGGKAFSVASYGVVMAVMTVFEAIGSQRPGWVKRWLEDFKAVFVLTIAMAISLWFIPVAGQRGTLALLSLFAYFMGLAYPIQRQLINDLIPDSRYRATIMSLESIADRAVNAWLAAEIGGYLERGRLDDFLLLSAELTVGFSIVLWAIASVKKFRRRQTQCP